MIYLLTYLQIIGQNKLVSHLYLAADDSVFLSQHR